MKFFQNSSLTLKQLVFLSWIAPVLLTLCSSIAVFFFLGWLDFQNNIDLAGGNLSLKSKVAARRIAAELMLKESGSVDAVSRKLASELEVSGLSIALSAKCKIKSDSCRYESEGLVSIFRRVPHVEDVQFVVVSQKLKPFTSFLNPKFLLWSVLPVVFLIASGLFFQLMFLRKHVINPVGLLVSAAERKIEAKSSWPIELRQIGENLSESFQAREQAVFALLAKGVIHDIRTFLHSLLIAVDLIDESTEEKRRTRLDKLYEACKISLPKMKRIIELTLDGSRDIPIRPIKENIITTINGAVAANASYAKERTVEVIVKHDMCNLLLVHDPVQLERAFANLIRNGIEAVSTNERNEEIKSEVVISVMGKLDGEVEISVEDSGPGIGIEKENLFKPVKSQKAHGAGLGLYITKRIILGHQGRLQAMRSSLLGGARLLISLPKGGPA